MMVDILENVTLLLQSRYLVALMTRLRDRETGSREFAECFEKIAGLLMAAALEFVPIVNKKVVTPTGTQYAGMAYAKGVCGVSILRAGASFEESLRRAFWGELSFGKILIQRNEETAEAVHLYSKLPSDVSERIVFILEPMLATGGSAVKAIDILIQNGVKEENLVFVNCVASMEGVKVVMARFPKLRIVTAVVDSKLTISKHISPGLGDFGDRFYGTV